MRRRHDRSTTAEAGLPLAQVVETDDGTVRVLLDGQPLVVDPIDRRDLGRALSVLAEQHGRLRVELTDRAGRVFVDALDPPASPVPVAQPAPAGTRPGPPQSPPVDRGKQPELMEVSGEGFVPGEDVLVAVVIQSSSAGPGGRARGLIDPSLLPDGVRGVVLLGAVSGTLHVEYLP